MAVLDELASLPVFPRRHIGPSHGGVARGVAFRMLEKIRAHDGARFRASTLTTVPEVCLACDLQ